MTQTFPTRRQAPMALAQARRIVAQPQPGDSESQQRTAWAVLKSARGQPVLQHRLPTTPPAKTSPTTTPPGAA